MCDDSEFNLDERVLCSDDTCIGLVGSDGKCKVCGALYTGLEPLPEEKENGRIEDSADVAASAPTDDLSELLGEEPDESGANQDEDEAGSMSDVDERVCCPDDTCVGIIGPDGRCGTCGKYV